MNKDNKKHVLVINPGSVSTKLAVYTEEDCISFSTIFHDTDSIKKYKSIYEQKDMRTEVVFKWLKSDGISLESLRAVVGRGGLLRPMPGGTYKITKKMLDDLKIGYQGQHASNLGGIIAFKIAKEANIPSFIVDPVSVDEFEDVARISGIPEISRKSLLHSLNIKAVTRRVCSRIGKDFYSSSYIVAHLGGGISVASIKNGKVVDVNNANEQGPFSPERAGDIPARGIMEMCFSGKYTHEEMKKKVIGQAGLTAYLKTSDGKIINKMIEDGNENAKLILNAMAYQIAKEIGSMATVLKGQIDAIILTGGLAYNKMLINWITEMISFIAPIEIVPGENEMLALAEGAFRVLNCKEDAKIYEYELGLND